jgi:hypothetical protein
MEVVMQFRSIIGILWSLPMATALLVGQAEWTRDYVLTVSADTHHDLDGRTLDTRLAVTSRVRVQGLGPAGYRLTLLGGEIEPTTSGKMTFAGVRNADSGLTLIVPLKPDGQPAQVPVPSGAVGRHLHEGMLFLLPRTLDPGGAVVDTVTVNSEDQYSMYQSIRRVSWSSAVPGSGDSIGVEVRGEGSATSTMGVTSSSDRVEGSGWSVYSDHVVLRSKVELTQVTEGQTAEGGSYRADRRSIITVEPDGVETSGPSP